MGPTIVEETRETTVIDCLEQYGANRALHGSGIPPCSIAVGVHP